MIRLMVQAMTLIRPMKKIGDMARSRNRGGKTIILEPRRLLHCSGVMSATKTAIRNRQVQEQELLKRGFRLDKRARINPATLSHDLLHKPSTDNAVSLFKSEEGLFEKRMGRSQLSILQHRDPGSVQEEAERPEVELFWTSTSQTISEKSELGSRTLGDQSSVMRFYEKCLKRARDKQKRAEYRKLQQTQLDLKAAKATGGRRGRRKSAASQLSAL